MSSEPTNAVLYARISEDATGEGAGVQRQREETRALAKARGWTVVGDFADNDISALAGGDRPEYEAMRRRLQDGDVHRVVVWHTSRLWRNRTERARDIGALAKLRCGVIAVKGPDLDLSTAYGRGLAGLIGEFDTMESEVKGERVAAAAADRARRGLPNGGLGYGWRRDEDSTGEWLIHEEEAATVREIVQRLTRGETLAGVTAWLNESGRPAPGAQHGRARRGVTNASGDLWGKTSVRKIALRPSNAALRIHHRGREDEQTFAGAWPALITREQWEQVCAILTAPGRGQVRPGNRRHLLSWGIGQCGVCGGVLRVATKGNARYGQKQELYVCDAIGCVGRNKAAVDGMVRELVIGRLAMPDAIDLLAGDDRQAREAMEQARALRDRLDLAADEYAEGRITAQQLSRITARLQPEIEAAEAMAQRARSSVSVDLLRDLGGKAAAERWDALGVAQQRAVVDVLISSVTINRVERRGPGFDPTSVAIEWQRA